MQILSICPRSCLLEGSRYGRLAIGKLGMPCVCWVCGGVGKGSWAPYGFTGEHLWGTIYIEYLLAYTESASAHVQPAPSHVVDIDLQSDLQQSTGP